MPEFYSRGETELTYDEQHAALLADLDGKRFRADWHGVSDAANDLRVLEAGSPEEKAALAPHDDMVDAFAYSLWTKRRYPCGCTAFGPGDVPNYCPEHEATMVAHREDFERARITFAYAMTGIAGVLVGWILAKIF